MTLAQPKAYEVRTLPLGDRSVECILRDFGPSPWLFCHVHDDEQTAVEAALRVLKGRGGRFLTLSNNGQRNLAFRVRGREYVVDPNRIFTETGVRKSLQQLSADEAPAREAAQRFGQALLELYRTEDWAAVIALHNNTEGHYSVLSYRTDPEIRRDAARVHVVEDRDPDDFFFVTDEGLFEALAKLGHNVVLQNNSDATDDGSLSVYCARHGVFYVNIEAQHGHLQEQVTMLEALIPLLPTQRAPARESEPGVQGVASRDPQELELVDLSEVDRSFVIEARYATEHNFTGQALYPRNELYLERSAAERLARVQKRLRALGYGLKIWDAYRPLSVQRKFWALVPDPRYVANPAQGSRHNRGSAVDVTLVDAQGKELPMPTDFDDFSPRAHRDFTELPPEVIRNRRILEEAMQAEGFLPLATEWWHFDAPGWENFPVSDIDPYTKKP